MTPFTDRSAATWWIIQDNWYYQLYKEDVVWLIYQTGLDEWNRKLMEGLKTLKSCGEILISKMMKMFNSLVIRQAQWNIILQKHRNILKSTIWVILTKYLVKVVSRTVLAGRYSL